MTRIRNIIIYIIVCIIVISSFKIPEILLNIENNNIEIEVYEKKKKYSNIDIETEKIYLVKAIHEIEEGKSVELVSYKEGLLIIGEKFDSRQGIMKNINDEVLKLNEYNVLKDTNLVGNPQFRLEILNKNYRNKENLYIIEHVALQSNDNKCFINIENKTGKIIFISFDKNYLYNDDKKKMLENYIKYLNLYIIEDWKYEIDEVNKKYSMKSEKADIIISLVESEKNYMFTCHILGN